MRTLCLVSLLVALSAPVRLSAADQDGVALAIIFDTSGSMRESVRDRSGKQTPKYIIAKRALTQVSKRLEEFVKQPAGGTPRTLHVGLFTFRGDGAAAVVPFGPFDATAIENWAGKFNRPTGNTPLGNSLSTAIHAVLGSPLPRKHVLVITDGINTAGPQPSAVLPRLKREADDKQAIVSTHFIAFDVDAKEFAGVKKLGATVVSAADETQLNTQLSFIMEKKILLEDEEPK